MGLFEKDEKGNLKNTPKNTILLFGTIFVTAFVIYKILPKSFKK